MGIPLPVWVSMRSAETALAPVFHLMQTDIQGSIFRVILNAMVRVGVSNPGYSTNICGASFETNSAVCVTGRMQGPP